MEIPAGEFKAKCLQIMERVARTGKAITITKRGVPVAKLVPPDTQAPRAPLFGRMAESVSYEGDLLNPVGADWEVLSTQEAIAYDGVKHQRATHRVADAVRRKPRR